MVLHKIASKTALIVCAYLLFCIVAGSQSQNVRCIRRSNAIDTAAQELQTRLISWFGQHGNSQLHEPDGVYIYDHLGARDLLRTGMGKHGPQSRV